MKKQIIFFETQSGARTNIMANFHILDKAAFIHKVYHSDTKSSYWSMFRYGYVGGFADNLKGMTLEEFESEFTNADFCEFTKEQVDRLFRKDICMRWGTAGERAAIRPLRKSELKIGHTYVDFSGVNYLYLGRVKATSRLKYSPLPSTEEGFGFQWFPLSSLEASAYEINVLKSIKRLEKDTGRKAVPLKRHYNYSSDSRYANIQNKSVELLDVPEDEN